MKKIYVLFLVLLFQNLFAQTSPDDDIQISILTVGTADESHSLYGHTAIRIQDDFRGIDHVFNYGMFDFSTPNFMLRFVKGDMQYFAGAYPYADFEYNYRYENRSIYEQTLALSTEEKLNLINALQESIKGDDKFYTYKFIDRNCTTKVVDVVNSILQDKKVIYKHDISDLTYRDVLYPYAENHFFQKLGINIMFGTKVDDQASKVFLPFDLKNNLDKTIYKNKPLVTKNVTLFEAHREPKKVWWDSIYSLIFVLTLLIVIPKKTIAKTYFLVSGVLGIFFCLIGFYSFHQELLWNYNALLFNPILILAVYFDWKKNSRAFVWTSYITLVCTVLYLIYMLDKIHLGIVWPFIIANSILLLRGLLPYTTKKKS